MDPLYELALSIKAAHRELDRRIGEAMRPLGLSAPQADALYVIGKTEPLSLKELGELLIAEAGHPSRLVDRLVEAGYVDRRAAEDDRRRIVLTLTSDGRRVEQRIQALRLEVLDLARSLLGDADLDATLALFRRMLEVSEYSDLLRRRRALEEG